MKYPLADEPPIEFTLTPNERTEAARYRVDIERNRRRANGRVQAKEDRLLLLALANAQGTGSRSDATTRDVGGTSRAMQA